MNKLGSAQSPFQDDDSLPRRASVQPFCVGRKLKTTWVPLWLKEQLQCDYMMFSTISLSGGKYWESMVIKKALANPKACWLVA